MKITRDEARRVAELAHLEFDDAALDRLAEEMTKILGYVENLPSPNDERGTMNDEPLRTPMRPDLVVSSLDRDAVAQNAPSWHDGFFVVPKVIE